VENKPQETNRNDSSHFAKIRECVTHRQNAPLSVADPSGLIPGWTSYRVHFTATLPPDTTIDKRVVAKSFLIDSNPEIGNEAQAKAA
jgi:hypothetical protein